MVIKCGCAGPLPSKHNNGATNYIVQLGFGKLVQMFRGWWFADINKKTFMFALFGDIYVKCTLMDIYAHIPT